MHDAEDKKSLHADNGSEVARKSSLGRDEAGDDDWHDSEKLRRQQQCRCVAREPRQRHKTCNVVEEPWLQEYAVEVEQLNVPNPRKNHGHGFTRRVGESLRFVRSADMVMKLEHFHSC